MQSAWKPCCLWVGFALCIVTLSAQASPPETVGALLRQSGWSRWEIQAGRLTLPHIRLAPNRTLNQESMDVRESLHMNSSAEHASLKYNYQAPSLEWTLEWVDQHFTLHETSDTRSFQMEQLPNGHVTVIVLNADQPAVELKATGFWQFALIHTECFQHEVAPRLESLRHNWQLQSQADDIAKQLKIASASDWKSQRRRWRTAIEHLSSNSYGERVAAQALLAKERHALIPYLASLDLRSFDEEQQRRLEYLRGVQSTANESAEEVAAALVYDQALWCQFIEQGDIATRTGAVAHLSQLLDRPIPFDTNAQADRRAAEWEKIRRNLLPTQR
jgi:hypothetical protein